MLVISGFAFSKFLSLPCIDCVKGFKNENGPSKSFLKLSQSGVGLLNSFRAINKNTNPIKNNHGQMYFGINPEFLKPYIMAPHIKNRK